MTEKLNVNAIIGAIIGCGKNKGIQAVACDSTKMFSNFWVVTFYLHIPLNVMALR